MSAAIECPICLRWVDWEATPPVVFGADDRPEILRKDPREDEVAWQTRLQTAYRPCSGVGSADSHYLPYDYADYRPIIVGVFGESRSGKSHLVAAMISRLCANDAALRRLGLTVDPLDLRTHQQYMSRTVEPFIKGRRRLDPTQPLPVAFTDALRVTNAAGDSFAVSFFDVAGEQLERSDPEVRFFGSVNALLFVIDPDSIPGLTQPAATAIGDSTFEEALKRLGGRPSPGKEFLHLPAALVVAKADLLRYSFDLAGEWMSRSGGAEETDLSTVERESEDVYALLVERGAEPWLRPAERCYRSTLHFASATNVSPTESAYGEGFAQRRVLKPLLALFAMTGVLDEELMRPVRGDDDAAS
ncbi:hypothetical protein [Nonomuraea africana]|uniref:ATP-binding protein n=1 Tax=Nonomuraea africana TaxID=46171 RepID=A0ABR9KGR1_9ACTN|nr:hypothetical protein [Nonomuraea africana]MBE1560742.1 hypothetical protein [Nonomuraea africana]